MGFLGDLVVGLFVVLMMAAAFSWMVNNPTEATQLFKDLGKVGLEVGKTMLKIIVEVIKSISKSG
jgi:hypothetical protein